MIVGVVVALTLALAWVVAGESSPWSITEPRRTAAMDSTGAVGALAATDYFRAVQRHALATGKLQHLAAMSEADCFACQTGMQVVFTTRAHRTRLIIGATRWIGEPEVTDLGDGTWLVGGPARFGSSVLRDFFGRTLHELDPGDGEEWYLVVHQGDWRVRESGDRADLIELANGGGEP